MSSEFDINHWFETQGKLHIGCTTGVPGRWIAHTLCGRRIWNWIGFGFDSLHYAKTDKICTDCAAMWLQHYLEKCNLTKKRLSVVTENKTEGT